MEKEPQAWSCRTLKGAPFSYHHPRSYRPAGLSEHKTSLPKLEGHKNPGSRGLRPGSRWDWAAKSNSICYLNALQDLPTVPQG